MKRLQPRPSCKCTPALKPANRSPLSVPHVVFPLLGLTLDSGDFRRSSRQLSALGNLPPTYLTTAMLIRVIYRNYFHLLLITMKPYNSICVPLFIPLTWAEHLLSATVLGIGDARIEFACQINLVTFWFWFEPRKSSLRACLFFMFYSSCSMLNSLYLKKQQAFWFSIHKKEGRFETCGAEWACEILGPNPQLYLWYSHPGSAKRDCATCSTCFGSSSAVIAIFMYIINLGG